MSSGRKRSPESRHKNVSAEPTGVRPVRRPGIVGRIATSLPFLCLVALIVRLGFFWDYVRQNSPHALAVLPFLQESGNIAASLASGHGFGSPFRVDTGLTAWMAPVYPWLLSVIFRAFGVRTYDSFVAAAGFNILCSVLTCIPIYFAGKRIAGRAVGAMAVWLWVIFPNSILNTFQSMWDASLGALLAATILWATLAIEKSERRRDWCAYGGLWGLALMTNAALLALLPLLVGWLAYRRWREARDPLAKPRIATSAPAKPALAAAIVMLCCLPWTIRNYRVFHSAIPFRSNLGLQLWLGNNENASEAWREQLHPIFNTEERARYIQLGEVNYMQEKKREAIDYMLRHPAREAQLISSRFVATWSGGTANPVDDFIRIPGLWFRGVLLFNLLLAAGAVAGIAVLWRRRSAYLVPIAVFPIVFPWAYYFTLAYPRYRLPIDPAVMLLTATALAAAFRPGEFAAGASEHR